MLKTSWWICHTNTVFALLERCGLLVDYCDVFMSCFYTHFDGTHSLQRIHWWASDEMLHFSKSVLMKKQTHLGWLEVEHIFSKFSNFVKNVHWDFRQNVVRSWCEGLSWRDVHDQRLGAFHTSWATRQHLGLIAACSCFDAPHTDCEEPLRAECKH